MDRHPYAVLMVKQFDSGRCAGSLIADNAVLTAGYCAGERMGLSEVRVGIHDVEGPAAEYMTAGILKEVVHPEYIGEDNDYENNLAIFILETRIEGIRPVCMADPALDISSGKELLILGWGSTDKNGLSYSSVLQEANVEYISNKECRETHDYNDDDYNDVYSFNFIDVDTYMCTTSSERKGLCYGDGGGPLIAKGGDAEEDILVGVTSKYGCGERPDVSSRISAERAWIDGVVAENDGVTCEEYSVPTTSVPTPTTSAPTTFPSSSPLALPSARPSSSPSAFPSSSLSARPSAVPSSSPSAYPSALLSSSAPTTTA